MKQHWRSNSSFINFVRHILQLLWAPSLLCALPRWRLWQNCHFRHICQIRRFRQLLWAPFTALCFASLAIVAKLSFSPSFAKFAAFANFYGPLHCFVFCLVGDCGKIVIFAIFAKFAVFANSYGAPILLCALPRWRLWQNCHFRHICQIRRFRQCLWAPFTASCFASLAIVAKLSFSPYLPKFAAFANFYGAPFTALCFASLAIVAKLSFSPYLPNSPFSPTLMGPLYCFVFCLVGDCGKIVIFAIFAKFAVFANSYGAPILLCALPRWRLWQNCHFRHICQIRRFRQCLWAPFTASCFASLAIVAKLSFSPYLPNSPLSPTFMGPLHCFVFCLVGDCGKIVIFAVFAKFAVFANSYGAPILLCALPRWRLWQNCHFRHICQIRRFRQCLWAPSLLRALPRWRLWQNCHFRHICQIRRFRQLLWGPFTALCFASLAIVAKLSFSPYLPNSPFSPTLMGPLYCFVFCLVGDCGKIVIFAIFAKFAVFANSYGAPILLCALPRWRLWQNCHFRHICQIRRFRQCLWAPFTASCFASLAIVAKLSFSPYLPNFAAFANFYGAPSLLCVLPRWRLWQNCHFRRICQIRRFRQLLWGPYTALCFASLAIVAKLSFSPYLPNSPLSPMFMGPLHCFVLCLVGDCGKIVIFAIFAKFAAFANFYGAPSLLCALPRWRLWQNCHFRHICQIRQHYLFFAIFVVVCISGHISLLLN